MADMREEAAIRVVDDEASVRHSWEFILESAGWTVRSYASAEAFLKLDDPHIPRDPHDGTDRGWCVVLDVQMPGMSGIELMRELASRSNRLPVIFATAHGDIDMAVQALKDGASDFLPKPVKADRLIAAIEKAVKADLERRKAEDGIAAARTLWDTLTPREKEVAKGVAAGDLNKQVADRLGITEKTVQAHRSSLLRKLGLRGSAELASFLISIGER